MECQLWDVKLGRRIAHHYAISVRIDHRQDILLSHSSHSKFGVFGGKNDGVVVLGIEVVVFGGCRSRCPEVGSRLLHIRLLLVVRTRYSTPVILTK